MYLVINLGLKSIRGIVFDESSEQVYSSAYPVHTSLSHDVVVQDANEWILLLGKVLEDIRTRTDLLPRIQYITVTTSSSCVFGTDDQMKPVTPVMMVSDRRAHKTAEEIQADPRFVVVAKRRHLTCPASSLVPKALWYTRNHQGTSGQIRWWLGAGEFLNHYFTGRAITDPLNAEKAFHNGLDYETDLLSHLGLDTTKLPPVMEVGTPMEIPVQISRRLGLSRDCLFIVSTYDAICAVFGSARAHARSGCDVSGTVTSVRVLRNEAPEYDSPILLTQHVAPMAKYLIGSSNNLGGGIVEWYRQAFFEGDEDDVYSRVENMANMANPGADGLLFLPYLMGERAPFIEPRATGSFFGVQRTSTANHFARAVLESTAYVTRDLVDLIRRNGIEIDSLTASGGLSRFDLVNQIKADVCNVPVYVLDNFESTSVGALVIMLVANRTYRNTDDALAAAVRIRKVIQPSDRRHAIYEKHFELYKIVNRDLHEAYEKHEELKRSQAIHLNQIVRNL